ncbi:MAG: Holliday junction resolvase RuvX, partial [Candidatus Latescibacteria bacterium]|nr:Holliday junction resolvase RuvX [Candidatus Latescibacterota bacterium]
MSILGVDYGTRRVGIAVSDPLGIDAHPRPTLIVTGTKDAVRQIVGLVQELDDLKTIVVGLPLHLDGGESEQTLITRKFAEALEIQVSVPVVFMDEGLTSWAAEQEMIEAAAAEEAFAVAAMDGQRRKSRGKRRAIRSKQVVDQRAAVLILRDYLK